MIASTARRRTASRCSTSSTRARARPRPSGERIFESFYQGKPPVEGRVKGSGLGLAIAREYALAHGGRIELLDRTDTARRAFPAVAAARGDAADRSPPRQGQRRPSAPCREEGERAASELRYAPVAAGGNAARPARMPPPPQRRAAGAAAGPLADAQRSRRRRRAPDPLDAGRSGAQAPAQAPAPATAPQPSAAAPQRRRAPSGRNRRRRRDHRPTRTSSRLTRVLADLQRYGALSRRRSPPRARRVTQATATRAAHRRQPHPARGAADAGRRHPQDDQRALQLLENVVQEQARRAGR